MISLVDTGEKMAEQDLTLSDIGSFIPSTFVWDVSAIHDIDINSQQFKELFVRLYQNVNIIATNVNLKDTGYYQTTEFLNGQQYFPDPNLTELNANPEPIYRNVYRIVINFGALPNSATKSVAHGLTVDKNFIWTRIYGGATNPIGLLGAPLPNSDIKLSVDTINVNVTTAADYSAYTTTYIVLEYLKQAG